MKKSVFKDSYFQRFFGVYENISLKSIILPLLPMNKCMVRQIIVLLILIPFAGLTQNSSLKVHKDEKSYVFGQIFTDFQYGLKDTYKPRAAFRFNQGIIGYKHTFSDK
jgi:hypothetical protein